MTAKKNRRRGVVLSSSGQRKLETARRQLEKMSNGGDRFTLEELSERTQLALSTITRVLDGQVGVDKQTLAQFFAAFDLILERSDYQHPDTLDSVQNSHPDAQETLPAIPNAIAPPQPTLHTIDWGEAIDVSTFYGRTTELAILEQWIQQDRCRLIGLLGMGGIGKTALSVKLAQQIAQQAEANSFSSSSSPPSLHAPFEFIIWRTLRNAPPVELLLTDLIQVLSRQQESVPALEAVALMSRLMHYLRQHRCLLILDNGETILQGGQFTGAYRPEYETYGELLRQVGEIRHQSCLVLTSREKPQTIASLEGETLPVRSFALPGLPATDSDHLFDAIGLSPSPVGRHKLMEIYSGNPLALKIVATSIRELFGGDVDAFLGEETTVFNGIRRLLDQQYQRLTPLEKQVMYWLAINREWVTIAELQSDMVPAVPKQRLLETLESLARRSLIEQNNARFTQQPVVMEYIIDGLIDQVCEEIRQRLPQLFLTHALIKATAKEYVRDIQIRVILKPLVDRLLARFGSNASLITQLQRLLAQLHELTVNQSGYGAGNLLNLLYHLKADVSGYDFSYLTIRQACLHLALHRVNLSHAHLVACRFAERVPHPNSMSVSPDGDRVAIGGEGGRIQMWQVSTGRPLLTIQAHKTFVFALTFSPDGQMLVSGSMDVGIKFWDLTTGNCIQTWESEKPWALAFSPDGRLLAGSSADNDRSIHLWDWQTGQRLQTLTGHSGPASGLAFAPRPVTATTETNLERLFLVSGGQDCLAKVWDVERGVCLHTLTEHTGMIWTVSCHPNGDCFATGSFDHSIKLWDLETGACLQTLRGHTAEITGVSFSPDGQLLASASSDRTIRLWDVVTGQCLNVLQGHLDSVWAVAFTRGYNPNGDWAAGQTLVSVGMDQTVRFWNVRRMAAASSAIGARNAAQNISQNAAQNISQPDTLESISGQCIKTIQGGCYGIRSIDCHHQTGWLASGGLGGLIRLWDPSGQCLRTFSGHTSGIWKLSFHPAGKLLASASLNGEIRIWELETGRCLHSLWRNNSWIQAFGFSPQGYLVSASSSDATIRFWDSHTGECWRSIVLDADAYLLGLAFHPQGHYFVTAGNDSQLRWWDMETGECFQVRSGKEGHAWAIAFHPQGHLFASIGNDLEVKLWDAEAGECIGLLQGHRGIHGSVAFSRDGSVLASGRSDCTIRLWDVKTRQCLKILEGHTASITSVIFLPLNASAPPETQRQILASGSLDETIRLWDMQTETCLRTLRPDRLYEGMNITGITGLTEEVIATLKSLGAVEQ